VMELGITWAAWLSMLLPFATLPAPISSGRHSARFCLLQHCLHLFPLVGTQHTQVEEATDLSYAHFGEQGFHGGMKAVRQCELRCEGCPQASWSFRVIPERGLSVIHSP
jgi:hypothetical protein